MRQLLAVAQALLVALASSAPTTSRLPNPFLRRQDNNFDEFDLFDIQKIAAIGDSYSAGIGAGNKLGGWTDPGAWACKFLHRITLHLLRLTYTRSGSRYDSSYPALVSDYLEGLTEPMQFHSCSGHTIPEVIADQMWRVHGDLDAILVSAGKYYFTTCIGSRS